MGSVVSRITTGSLGLDLASAVINRSLGAAEQDEKGARFFTLPQSFINSCPPKPSGSQHHWAHLYYTYYLRIPSSNLAGPG